MPELVAKEITVRGGGGVLVDHASFCVGPGELVSLLGPNGAGKTTLLRAAVGIEKPTGGSATLGGADSTTLSPVDRARRVSYLPQTRQLTWPNPVRDVVALGRFAHGAALGRIRGEDAEAVERAMKACDLLHLAHRETHTLSGGELARVHCARAFAAETPLLVADEPVAALDPRHQLRIMDLIRKFVAEGGGALVVLHDIGLAARYADRMIWMKDGRIVADGSTAETLSADRLRFVYGVKARVAGVFVEIEGAA